MMPKHCTTAVTEYFIINAHYKWPFALENNAEMKHGQQFSISKCRELYVRIILNILTICHNLLNLAVGFRLLQIFCCILHHLGTPSGSATGYTVMGQAIAIQRL